MMILIYIQSQLLQKNKYLHVVYLYLFTCSLFNDAISSSDYIVSNERMISKQ
jgi:hypothetical protein